MTDKRELDALVAFIGGTSRTLEQWLEFARRDDCLDKMVPSDLRALLGALSRALTRPASGDAVEELRERVRHWREMPSLLSAVDLIADMERALDTLTTEAPAQTDENGKLTQPPPDRATPEERERRVRELVAKLTAYQEADKAPAQTEQGGERADLQGQKQSADTTATPPTSAQTEAMALASIHEFIAGCTCQSDRDAILTHVSTLRQPASVEAEPVAWRYEPINGNEEKPFIFEHRGNMDKRFWREVPLYAHPPADAEPVALHPIVREIMAEVTKATEKFPTWPTRIIDAGNVVAEEAGELSKACLQVVYEPHKETMDGVRTEAIQTAAMCFRFIASMDRYDVTEGPQHEQPRIDAHLADQVQS